MISEKRSSMLHGVLLITLFSCAAFYIGEMNFVKELSFSPMIVGIILGMLYANSLRNNLPETWVPGIQFCSKRILRIGIILYGFRLTFQDVLAVGLPAIFIDTIIVTTTILGGILIGRMLKMDRGIALLTSIGSGICGAAAILGAESTIQTPNPIKQPWLFPLLLFLELYPCSFILYYIIMAHSYFLPMKWVYSPERPCMR